MINPKIREPMGIPQRYRLALAEYAAGAGEVALATAYELGRSAAAEGMGLLEMTSIHHEALIDLSARGTVLVPLPRASQFLAETLSYFELTLRAHRDSARLLGLSATSGPADAEIERAREQLRTVLDATTAVIYLKDAQGRYLFVNRQFQRVFGVTREDVLGKTDEQVLPLPIARTLWDDDENVLRGAVPQELEETLTTEQGTNTYIALKFPLLDEAGSAHAICCVATDITERKRADEALRAAKEAAERANQELESFSYSVAHDLRAPLRAIDGFSQALMEDCCGELGEQGSRYIKYVRDATRQMSQLIEDLLALSRIAGGDFCRTQVDLSAIAYRTLERLKAADPGRRVSLQVQDHVFASCDAGLAAIVLDNLLRNAWKFTAKREDARITFGQLQTSEGRTMFVQDNGAGFDMTYAHKLFVVCQRLHSAEEFEGTGVGLATVQRVIRRHGGRVWAAGSPGEGAAFYFTLGENGSRG